jgi:hypothetical protein
MAEIAAGIARDADQPMALRLAAAVAAGKIATSAAPVIRSAFESARDRLGYADSVLDTRLIVPGEPAGPERQRLALDLLADSRAPVPKASEGVEAAAAPAGPATLPAGAPDW